MAQSKKKRALPVRLAVRGFNNATRPQRAVLGVVGRSAGRRISKHSGVTGAELRTHLKNAKLGNSADRLAGAKLGAKLAKGVLISGMPGASRMHWSKVGKATKKTSGVDIHSAEFKALTPKQKAKVLASGGARLGIAAATVAAGPAHGNKAAQKFLLGVGLGHTAATVGRAVTSGDQSKKAIRKTDKMAKLQVGGFAGKHRKLAGFATKRIVRDVRTNVVTNADLAALRSAKTPGEKLRARANIAAKATIYAAKKNPGTRLQAGIAGRLLAKRNPGTRLPGGGAGRLWNEALHPRLHGKFTHK